MLIRITCYYYNIQSEVRKVYKLLLEARDTEGENFSGFDLKLDRGRLIGKDLNCTL